MFRTEKFGGPTVEKYGGRDLVRASLKASDLKSVGENTQSRERCGWTGSPKGK